jgi:serine/threonine protein phosphatase PrpC
MQLSVDHKPGDPSEQARVCKAGGVVEQSKDGKGNPIGPLRVWVANSFPPLPGLAMTRSLGDKLGAQAGIIATPELSEYTLQPSDMFLILATDGIWEFCSDDEIVTLAGEYWLRGEMDRAANRLVDHAKAAWDKARVNVVDDITIVVAVLKHPAE